MSFSKAERDLRSRRLNPCDDLYWQCRGYSERPDNWQELLGWDQDSEDGSYESESDEYESEDDNCESESEYLARNLRSRQMNPCDHLYWQCRGYSCRPDNWQELMGWDQSSEDDDEYSEDEDSEEEVIEKSPEMKARDLRSRQLNPCDDLYWKCRGYSQRPDNWRVLLNSH